MCSQRTTAKPSDFEALARLAKEFHDALPGLDNSAALDKAYQAFSLAFLGCRFPDTAQGQANRESAAPALLRIVTREYVKRQVELEQRRHDLTGSWTLWMCSQESGKDFLVATGTEAAIRGRMHLEASLNRDVWLITPTGAKELPSATAGSDELDADTRVSPAPGC